MKATNFEFDGIASNDIGLYIVSFDGADSGEQDYGGSLVYNTSHAADSNQWKFHGSHYEDPLTFTFQTVRMDNKCGDPEIIQATNQALYNRIYKRRDGYKWLRFLDEEGMEDTYYRCTLDFKWYKINGEIYGMTFTVTCDAPYGYTDIQEYTSPEGGLDVDSPVRIFSNSDYVGNAYIEEIKIKPYIDGKVIINNSTQADYQTLELGNGNVYADMEIDNCISGEAINYNGTTKIITTDSETHSKTLASDYNYHPLQLVNYDTITQFTFEDEDGNKTSLPQLISIRDNIITNKSDGNIDLYIKYRGIRTGVI